MAVYLLMKRQNFTLVEIIVVMVIVMILAGIVVGIVRSTSRKNFSVYTKGQLKQLGIAFNSYKQDWGYYPPSRNGITPKTIKNALKDQSASDRAKFHSPKSVLYLDQIENYYTDMNDIPYFYICPGKINTESFDLWSLGYDGMAGIELNWTEDNESAIGSATQNNYLESKCDDLCNWERL